MKIKEILIVYPQHLIIVFPLHLYINQLINNIIKNIDDWGLLKKKISGKEKYFLFFLEKEIENIYQTLDIFYKKINLKIITVYKKEKLDLDFIDYIKDVDFLIKSVLKMFNKKNKFFIKDFPENINLTGSELTFRNLKIGISNGNLEEFLFKTKQLLK